VAADAFPFTVS